MELIGIDLPLAAWILIFIIATALVVVIYTLVAIGIGRFLEFFLGLDSANDFVERSVKPVEILWYMGNAGRAVLAIPWRVRRKTVFTEVLDFRPEGLFRHTEWDQKEVDTKLCRFAIAYNAACDSQEKARQRPHAREISHVDMRPYDERVGETKAEFWRAHNLAEHLGFKVRYAHTEYLPSETPTRETATV